MNVFYLWLEWKGFNHAVLVFRATRKDAQKWFDSLNLPGWLKAKYHLLECRDDTTVPAEFPAKGAVSGISLKNYDSDTAECYVNIKNDDGTYTRLTKLQKAFELSFKLEQPLHDSRDAEGNSWRTRTRLF